MPSADDIIRNVADQHPGYIVERCRGRHVGGAHKDDWEIDVLEHIQLERSVYHPLDEGCDRANQENESETVVKVTVREQTLWSDHTPL